MLMKINNRLKKLPKYARDNIRYIDLFNYLEAKILLELNYKEPTKIDKKDLLKKFMVQPKKYSYE
jgi:hypothetical protein